LTGEIAASLHTNKTIQFGASSSMITGPYDVNQHTVMGVAYTNTQYYFKATGTSSYFPASNYTWTLFSPTGNPTLYGGSQPYITFNESGNHTLEVAKSSDCGTVTSSIFIDVQDNFSGFSIMASPNPVTSENLTITIQDESKQVQSLPENGEMKVELFHFNSATKRKQWTFKNHQRQLNLNFKGIEKGIYILRVSKGSHQQSKQIIIE